MTGRLTLAGLYPEDTPLSDWTAAVFAVLVDLGASGAKVEGVDKLAGDLERAIPGDVDESDELDPETWGTSAAAQDAAARLASAFGIRIPGADEPGGASS